MFTDIHQDIFNSTQKTKQFWLKVVQSICFSPQVSLIVPMWVTEYTPLSVLSLYYYHFVPEVFETLPLKYINQSNQDMTV